MNQKILIRKATHLDIDQLLELLQDLFSTEGDFTFDEAKQRQGLGLLLNNPLSSCIVVAELQGQVIGMCTAQLLISTAEGGKSALIEDVVVHQDHRGRGIGRKLLSTIGDWSKAQRALRLVLLADQNNHPALKFYEELEWQRTDLICYHNKNF